MPKSDKTISNQKLSQLLDGEWFDLDAADCVASLCADKSLRSKWSRYHIIRDAVKGESLQPNQALANRICEAVRGEATYTNITELSHIRQSAVVNAAAEPMAAASGDDSVPVRNAKLTWLRTGVAGSALAASVALVTVVSLNYMDQLNSSDSGNAVTVASSGIASSPASDSTSDRAPEPVTGECDVAER